MTLCTHSVRKMALAGSLAAAMTLGASPTLAEQSDDEPTEMTKGEKRLAKLLEGRVAGKPQNCINDFRSTNLTVIDDTAYVYGRGHTIYVQRTRNPEDIDDGDILVSRRHSSQICRQDIVNTVDRYGGFFSGVVLFEDFIPYTRAKDGEG